MERTKSWKRWANLLLSEAAVGDIVDPFIADYLAEREADPNVERGIGRDAARLILSAWCRERWAIVVLTASHRLLHALGRLAPLGLLAVVAGLALLGLEAEGRRAWMAAGPLHLQPGLLALPLVVLALSPSGWRGPLLVGAFAAAMLAFGDLVTVIACTVAIVVAGALRRVPWAVPAAAATSVVLGPALLGEAPALFIYSGSATLAFLVIIALGARERPTAIA